MTEIEGRLEPSEEADHWVRILNFITDQKIIYEYYTEEEAVDVFFSTVQSCIKHELRDYDVTIDKKGDHWEAVFWYNRKTGWEAARIYIGSLSDE